MVASNTANIHNTNSSKGYKTDDSIQKRQHALQVFNAIELELTVYGNTHLNIGHVIQVNIPRTGRDKKGIKHEDNERYTSGRWVITAVRHNFNVGDQTSRSIITCIKETYGTALMEKTGPLNLDYKDEGKAINLYDDSEYN